MRWGSECRFTARRSRPPSTSWASGQPLATRPLCPASSSKYPYLHPAKAPKPRLHPQHLRGLGGSPLLCPHGDPHIVPGASLTNQLQLSFLPPPWGDCSSASLDPDFELEPSDPLGPPSPSAGPHSPYSLMGCRLACETRYVARKCGCRMMHMPGKGLVGAEEGVPGRAGAKGPRAGAVPEAVSSPITPRRRASVQPPAVQGLRQPGAR